MDTEVKCDKCGYVWVYRGKHRKKVMCPDCRRMVPLTLRAD